LENKDQVDAVMLILLATMGMLIIVFFIIIFVIIHQKKMLHHNNVIIETESKHQKNLLEASLFIAEKEREKIAANIHDDIGMMLNVLKLNLNRVHKNIENVILVNDILNNSYIIIDNSIESIRAISNELQPPTLNKLGFIKGVREICRQINLSGIIDVSLHTEEKEIKLEKQIEVQLYRLVKEVINNIVKHSKANQIRIAINSKITTLIIDITHDGIGITNEEIKYTAETNTTGLGLKSILTRSSIIEAKIDYHNLITELPKVTIELPIKK
jgi:two-component system, NarL family, sensor kinase